MEIIAEFAGKFVPVEDKSNPLSTSKNNALILLYIPVGPFALLYKPTIEREGPVNPIVPCAPTAPVTPCGPVIPVPPEKGVVDKKREVISITI